MTARRKEELPPVAVKRFTLAEIEVGIRKLNRRIGEVRELDPRVILYGDARIKNVEAGIRDVIREVFGQNSPEFRDHEYDRIWQGGMNLDDSAQERQAKFAAGIPQTITMFQGLISKLEEKREELPQAVQDAGAPICTTDARPDSRRVFVVHGRNTDARDAMFAFLRALSLEPIEWSEAIRLTAKPAPFIGEILDAAFAHARAVLVLMTPDDIACLQPALQCANDPPHEKTPTPQARPNVLFEAGMAMGRLADRTVLVQLGDLRPFSDIGGRHVVRLTNESTRRHDLADRLSLAGCAVNTSGREWHTAGDFDGSIPLERPDFGAQVLAPVVAESESAFAELLPRMRDLFNEMRSDLKADELGVVREFVVLPSRKVIFNSAKERFEYAEDEHAGLQNKVDLLASRGLVVDVGRGDTPIYRMTEEFVRLLLATS